MARGEAGVLPQAGLQVNSACWCAGRCSGIRRGGLMPASARCRARAAFFLTARGWTPRPGTLPPASSPAEGGLDPARGHPRRSQSPRRSLCRASPASPCWRPRRFSCRWAGSWRSSPLRTFASGPCADPVMGLPAAALTPASRASASGCSSRLTTGDDARGLACRPERRNGDAVPARRRVACLRPRRPPARPLQRRLSPHAAHAQGRSRSDVHPPQLFRR